MAELPYQTYERTTGKTWSPATSASAYSQYGIKSPIGSPEGNMALQKAMLAGTPTGTPTGTTTPPIGSTMSNTGTLPPPSGTTTPPPTFGSALNSAVSGSIPSTSLGANDTTASTFNIRKQYEDFFAARKAQQDKLLTAQAQTPEEIKLRGDLNALNISARKAIEIANQSGETQRFAGGEAARVQRQATIESQGLVDQINLMVDSRKVQIDAITSTMAFDKENMDALSNLSKLTQPDVISTGTDKKTGEIYSISRDPSTGKVTQSVIGKVSAQDTTEYSKTYTNAQGQIVAWGQDVNGNIVQKVLGQTEGKTSKTGDNTKPMDILDVARYNELYPTAGITAGDTQAQANMKVAQSNTPEAKTRNLVVGAKTAGNTYETVVSEINKDKTINDKATAISIANEVYGINGTAEGVANVAEQVYGKGNFSKISLDDEIKKGREENIKNGFGKDLGLREELFNKGYPIAQIDAKISPISTKINSFADSINKFLFGK